MKPSLPCFFCHPKTEAPSAFAVLKFLPQGVAAAKNLISRNGRMPTEGTHINPSSDEEMKAKIRYEKYKPTRIFFETLVGYQEASKVKTFDLYFGEKPEMRK